SRAEKTPSFEGLRKATKTRCASSSRAIGKLAPLSFMGHNAFGWPLLPSSTAIALARGTFTRIWLFLRSGWKPSGCAGNGKIGDLASRRWIDGRDTASSVADQNVLGDWIDPDIVCVIAQIDAADLDIICTAIQANRTVTAICDVQGIS